MWGRGWFVDDVFSPQLGYVTKPPESLILQRNSPDTWLGMLIKNSRKSNDIVSWVVGDCTIRMWYSCAIAALDFRIWFMFQYHDKETGGQLFVIGSKLYYAILLTKVCSKVIHTDTSVLLSRWLFYGLRKIVTGRIICTGRQTWLMIEFNNGGGWIGSRELSGLP